MRGRPSLARRLPRPSILKPEPRHLDSQPTRTHPTTHPHQHAVFDYRAAAADGAPLSKLVFFNWAPDAARVKAKMMYASTKDFFKGHLDGVSAEFQASEREEVAEAEVAEAVRALKRG